MSTKKPRSRKLGAVSPTSAPQTGRSWSAQPDGENSSLSKLPKPQNKITRLKHMNRVRRFNSQASRESPAILILAASSAEKCARSAARSSSKTMSVSRIADVTVMTNSFCFLALSEGGVCDCDRPPPPYRGGTRRIAMSWTADAAFSMPSRDLFKGWYIWTAIPTMASLLMLQLVLRRKVPTLPRILSFEACSAGPLNLLMTNFWIRRVVTVGSLQVTQTRLE